MRAISLRKRYEAGVQRPDPIPETILPEMRTGKSGAQKSMTQPRDWTAQPRIRQSLRPNLSEMNPLDRIPIIMEMDIMLTRNVEMDNKFDRNVEIDIVLTRNVEMDNKLDRNLGMGIKLAGNMDM